MLLENLKPNFIHEDERGGLIQLVREGYSQVNYIYSKKDCIRGNHYHKINTEAFYIIKGKIRLILEKEKLREEYEFNTGDMFQIFPEVRHTFEYIEDTELISLYSKGVELGNGQMDMYK